VPVLARLPASELVDQQTPLDEILGVSTIRPLEERMSHAADPGAELPSWLRSCSLAMRARLRQRRPPFTTGLRRERRWPP
jgi:hypothetical protein